MRISSALFVLVAIVAMVSLATYVSFTGPTEVVASDMAGPDVIERASPAENGGGLIRGDATMSVSTETPLVERSDNLLTRPIEDLLGVSIPWKKQPASPNRAAFYAALNPVDGAELVRLANEEDEAMAAAELATRKSLCNDVPATRAELEAEMQALEETGIVGTTLTEGHQLVSADEVQRRLTMMQGAFDQCESIRIALDGDDTDYMKLAADLGHTNAMVAYGRNVVADNADLAKQYFLSAWEAGEPNALLFWSNLENARFEQGIDPSADVESVAIFTVHAAVEEAKIALYNIPPSHPVAQAMAEAGDDARKKLNSLAGYKQDMAIARAKELIETNGRCCLRLD